MALVRAGQGQKMSKIQGNGFWIADIIDRIDLGIAGQQRTSA